MAHKCKIPHRIGYFGEFKSFLLSLAKKPEATPSSQHLLKEYLNLLAPGLSTEKYPPQLEITHVMGGKTTWLLGNFSS
jgi:ADP-heptose:LPS heptosyltransferase